MLPALRHTLACIPRYSSHSHDAEHWSDSGCRIAGICDWCNVRLHEYELIPVKLTKEPVRLTGIATMQMFLYSKLYVQDPIGLKLMASRGAPESATVSELLKLTGRCHLVRFGIFSSMYYLTASRGLDVFHTFMTVTSNWMYLIVHNGDIDINDTIPWSILQSSSLIIILM